MCSLNCEKQQERFIEMFATIKKGLTTYLRQPNQVLIPMKIEKEKRIKGLEFMNINVETKRVT